MKLLGTKTYLLKVFIGSVALALAVLSSFPGESGNVTFASENDPFAYKEIKAALASGENFIQYNRISGMLTDLLREQKRLFTEKKQAGKNEITTKIEELLNDASLSASERDYGQAYKILDGAHETLTESLKDLSKK